MSFISGDSYLTKRAKNSRMPHPPQTEINRGTVRQLSRWWPWLMLLAANIAHAGSPTEAARTIQQLLVSGRAVEAEQRAVEFLATARMGSRADSIAYFVATRALVAAQLQQGRLGDPALDSHVEALLRLAQSLFGPISAQRADACQYAGIISRSRNDLGAALGHFQDALRIIESHDPPNHAERANAYHNIGATHFMGRRYLDAQHAFDMSVKAWATVAPDTIAVTSGLVDLNEARQASGDTVGILPDYGRAERICELHEGPESPRLADVLVRDGSWRLTTGDVAGAGRVLDRAIGILQLPGHGGSPLADALLQRAKVQLAAGEGDLASALATRARDLYKTTGAPALSVALSLMTVADAERTAFHNEEATSAYQEALRVYRSLTPRRPAEEVDCLRKMAAHALNIGHFAEALDHSGRALQQSPGIWGARSSEVAITRVEYAAALKGVGEPDSARRHLELALKDLTAVVGDSSPLLATPILRLATLAREGGNLAQARGGADRALDLLERTYGPNDPRLCDALHELGIVKRQTGDPVGARSDLERALELVSKSGQDSESRATIVSSLGLLEWSLGNEDLAFARLNEALAMTGRVYGPEHPRTAAILRNLASLTNAMGRYSEARNLYERAIPIIERSKGLDDPDLAATRLGLGNAMKAMGDRIGARAQYDSAIEAHRNALGTEAPALALDYYNLATLSLEEKKLQEALQEAGEAERLGRRHFELIVRGVSEREALHFAADRVNGTDIILTAASRSGARDDCELAWDLVIRSRAAVIEEMAFRRRFAASNDDPAVVSLADRLARASDHLAFLAVHGRKEAESLAAFKQRLAAARLDKEDAERALATRSAEFSEATERAKIGLKEVLDALPARSVLIAWTQFSRLERTGSPGSQADGGERTYAAFVVDETTRDARLVSLGSVAEIDALVEQWRIQAGSDPEKGTIAAAEASCEKAGLALRKLVWDPVFPSHATADRVYLVPDGALCLVNFNALPNDAGGYLIENAPLLLTVGAERNLAIPARPEAGGSGLLIVGAPAYSTAPTIPSETASPSGSRGIPCGQFKALTFPPLEWTALEEEAIAQLWRARGQGAVLELTGADASERRFRTEADGRAVIHVATHGFFLGSECAVQSVNRGRSERDELTVGNLVAESPLLLSGLAFAGANLRGTIADSIDDGLLTAEEIAGLDLRAVDLAVLSACGTGLGQVQAGEGVIGLRRAFRVAGVRNLIMTLWSVKDDATARWMQELFARKLQADVETAEAVRSVSLQMIRERREQGKTDHPYFWGAFVATTD